LEQTGQLLDANYFLYTLPGDEPFLNQPWLAQWLMDAGFQTGGHSLLALARNGLAAVTWLAVIGVGVTRCRDVRVLGGYAMLTVAVAGSVFAVRTQMVVLPLYVLALGLLFGVADRRCEPWWLWVLVPLTALWANLHGSFVLLPGLTAFIAVPLIIERWWCDGEVSVSASFHWLGSTAAMLAAGCLNPHGTEIYTYVLRLALLSTVPETVTEWQPPDPTEPIGAAIIAGLVVSTAILVWRWRKVRWWEAAVFAVTGYLAATSVRSIFWWEVVALWTVPRHVSAVLGLEASWAQRERPGALGGVIHATAVLALAGAAIVVQPGLPGHIPVVKAGVAGAKTAGDGAYVLNEKHPIELIDKISGDDTETPPRVFHHQSIGGLLTFKLGMPEPTGQTAAPSLNTRRVAFVDQRMSMIPKEVWGAYFAVSRTQSGWRDIVRRHHIDWMLLYSPEEDDGEQAALLEAVRAASSWQRRGNTARWELFRRTGPVGTGR
jgi:hypothetical protein